ncbi:RIMS-binding protein 2-like isoform X3 [Ornithodoros turicata]|uniref:RIMS-binding protein 2-like isoform X3 n=1 Tax=Ornithodoros turicata TaxID=34597 RepID=UPI003138DD54
MELEVQRRPRETRALSLGATRKVEFVPVAKEKTSPASSRSGDSQPRQVEESQRLSSPFRRQSTKPRERVVTKCLLYQNVAELQHIIQRTAKDRLVLEHQVARLRKAAQEEKVKTKEELEARLRHAECRLHEREEELAQLQKELDDRREICADLERQLLEALEQKIEVEAEKSKLQEQVKCLHAAESECARALSLASSSASELRGVRAELHDLQQSAAALEALVTHLRRAADRRRDLERQHAQALEELRQRRQEATVAATAAARLTKDDSSLDTLKALESKVRELQKKCELQNVLHEELVLEMATLRRQQRRPARDAWRSGRSLSAEVTTGETFMLDDPLLDASTDTLLTTRIGARSASPPQLQIDTDNITSLDRSLLTTSSVGKRCADMSVSHSSATRVATQTMPSLQNCTSQEIDRILARIQQDNRVLAELEKSRATIGSPVSCANIQRLKQSIEQDARAVENSISVLQSSLKSSFSSPAIDQLMLEPRRTKHLYSQLRSRTLQRPTITMQDLDGLMAKLDRDNRILAELDKKRANIGSSLTYTSTLPTSTCLSERLCLASSSSATSVTLAQTPISSRPVLTLPSVPVSLPTNCTLVTSPMPKQQQQHQQHQQLPPTTTMVKEEGQTVVQPEEDMLCVESVEFVDLPGRGRCRVYIARYSYDPMKQSPNENPEAELYLNAGDYILIFGDMDEDGFFNGELLDGKKGLVPSNFVAKLTGEDLFEFQTTVLYGNRDSDDSSASFTYAADMDFMGSEDLHRLPPEDFHRMNDYIDLEDIEEVDEDALSEIERETEGPGPPPWCFPVPPPQRLVLERQLNKSILIGWLPPDVVLSSLESYQVYVDGVLKATIKAGQRTRALLEGVDSCQPHRISVRSVLTSGQHSRDAACTIVIGKNVPLAPSCVKASNVASTSALVSWLPSNSNFSHVVAVNSVEMKVVKPGVFRHLVSGLAPNTTYRVGVRAKPGRLLLHAATDDKDPRRLMGMLTAFVDFRTLPKGIPDPPVDIQVEAGPQEGTLLVTWLPVTINATAGTSNGAPVTGYAVYAAGRKLAEIDSPTGDHALLDISHLMPLHNKTVTVRTRAGDSLSVDSLPCIIPDELLRSKSAKAAEKTEEIHSELSDIVEEVEDELLENGDVHRGGRGNRCSTSGGGRKHHHHHHHHHHGHHSGRRERRNSAGQVIIEPDENLSDKEIYPLGRASSIPAIEITKDSAGGIVENYSEEEFEKYDFGRMARHRRHHGTSAPTLAPHANGGSLTYAERPRPTSPTPPTRTRHVSDEERAYYARSRAEYGGSSRKVRLFVALFDYDPQTMSPNPDAAEEELPFQEGQLIKIYGDKDPDGFYRGEANGRMGFVPCNMVSEVQVDDEEVVAQQMDPGPRHRPPQRGSRERDSWSAQQQPVKRMVALYDYDPQELSPNVDSEMELAFNTGDIIYVYGDMDEDGFFVGELNGVRGLVPSNFLTEAPPDYGDGGPRGRPQQLSAKASTRSRWKRSTAVVMSCATRPCTRTSVRPHLVRPMEARSLQDVPQWVGRTTPPHRRRRLEDTSVSRTPPGSSPTTTSEEEAGALTRGPRYRQVDHSTTRRLAAGGVMTAEVLTREAQRTGTMDLPDPGLRGGETRGVVSKAKTKKSRFRFLHVLKCLFRGKRKKE